jgi:hypothetical protein
MTDWTTDLRRHFSHTVGEKHDLLTHAPAQNMLDYMGEIPFGEVRNSLILNTRSAAHQLGMIY